MESEEPPLWQTMWRAKTVDIGILVAALLVLTAIFFFQDWLVKRPVFYDRVRLGFLVFTLVWLGWVRAGAAFDRQCARIFQRAQD